MRAIHRTDTTPEIKLRSALHARGFRYRKDFPIRIEGRLVRPDIVFTRRKIAIFVDGCFWHSCPEHGRSPAVNGAYWSPKLSRNAERDQEQNQLLKSEGWEVIRIWEHVQPAEAADSVIARLLA